MIVSGGNLKKMEMTAAMINMYSNYKKADR